MTLTELEARRTHAAKTLEKARAPLVAVEAAEQELADLDEQISQARATEADERRRQMERDQRLAEARRDIQAVEGLLTHPWITNPQLRTSVPTDDPVIRLARKAIYGAQALHDAGEDVPNEIVIRLKLGDWQ